jgi:hypothetical protein
MSIFKRSTDSKTSDSAGSPSPAVEPRHLTGEEFDQVISSSVRAVPRGGAFGGAISDRL